MTFSLVCHGVVITKLTSRIKMPVKTNDPFEVLPDEIISKIWWMLEPEDQVSLFYASPSVLQRNPPIRKTAVDQEHQFRGQKYKAQIFLDNIQGVLRLAHPEVWFQARKFIKEAP